MIGMMPILCLRHARGEIGKMLGGVHGVHGGLVLVGVHRWLG
jgi:hypothetical protein